jgi:hypothetical protein
MSRFTLDSASEFLFGHQMHALSEDLPFPHNAPFNHSSVKRAEKGFSQAFLEAQDIMVEREQYGWIWPFVEMKGDKTKKPMEVVNATLAPVIEKAIRKKEAEKACGGKENENEGEGETLLDHLVQLTTGE